MSRITMTTLAVAFATFLAAGAAFSQSAGPQGKGQIDDRASATACQPPWDRPNYLGDDWNIEHGMMPQWNSGVGSGAQGVDPWYDPPYRRFAKPVDKKDAQTLAQNYLDSTNNPNLKLGNEKDEVTDYEFDIVTRDNSLVDRLLVNKSSGKIRSVY